MQLDRRTRIRWWIAHAALPLATLSALAAMLAEPDLDARTLAPFREAGSGSYPLRESWFFGGVLRTGGEIMAAIATIGACMLAVASRRIPRWRPWCARLCYLAASAGATIAVAFAWDLASSAPAPSDASLAVTWRARAPSVLAASGFAWVALYYVGASVGARRRLTWLAPGLLLGTLLASAQHARGVQALTHVAGTLAIAWSVATGLAWLFRARGWLAWSERETASDATEGIAPRERAAPWLLATSGTLFGVFFYTADFLLEHFERDLAGVHDWFERAELAFMGPGLGLATYLVAERLMTARQRADERASAERQRRFEMLGRVAASVAHEVRNPLHALRLIVDEQRLDVPALDHHPLRGELEGCLQRIDHAVDLVYVLARPHADESGSADIAAIAREAAAMLQRASPTGPRFAFGDFPNEADAVAAPSLLRIVVENVLRNASQASKEGEEVDLALVRDRDEWVLEVRNPGQLGAKAVEVRDGASTGLGFGLTISRRIASDAGGRIDLYQRGGRVHCLVRWPASCEAS